MMQDADLTGSPSQKNIISQAWTRLSQVRTNRLFLVISHIILIYFLFNQIFYNIDMSVTLDSCYEININFYIFSIGDYGSTS